MALSQLVPQLTLSTTAATTALLLLVVLLAPSPNSVAVGELLPLCEKVSELSEDQKNLIGASRGRNRFPYSKRGGKEKDGSVMQTFLALDNDNHYNSGEEIEGVGVNGAEVRLRSGRYEGYKAPALYIKNRMRAVIAVVDYYRQGEEEGKDQAADGKAASPTASEHHHNKHFIIDQVVDAQILSPEGEQLRSEILANMLVKLVGRLAKEAIEAAATEGVAKIESEVNKEVELTFTFGFHTKQHPETSKRGILVYKMGFKKRSYAIYSALLELVEEKCKPPLQQQKEHQQKPSFHHLLLDLPKGVTIEAAKLDKNRGDMQFLEVKLRYRDHIDDAAAVAQKQQKEPPSPVAEVEQPPAAADVDGEEK